MVEKNKTLKVDNLKKNNFLDTSHYMSGKIAFKLNELSKAAVELENRKIRRSKCGSNNQ